MINNKIKSFNKLFSQDELIVLIAIFYLIIFIFMPALIWVPSIIRMPISLISIIILYIGILLKSKTVFGYVIIFTILVLAFNLLIYYAQNWHSNSSFFTKNYRLFLFWIAVPIGTYLLICKKQHLIRIVFYFSMLIISVTSITTIIGLNNFPYAARELANSNLPDINVFYYQKNIGDYGFIYMLVFLTMLLWGFLVKYKKIMYIIPLIFFYYTIILSQYTTAFIFSFVSPILIIMGKTKIKHIIFSLLCVVIVFILFRDILIDVTKYLAILFDNKGVDFLSLRFEQLTSSLLANSLVGGVEYRYDLYSQSYREFIANPIFGNGLFNDNVILGMHSEFFDLMGSLGIFGFIYIVIIFRWIFRKVYKIKIFNREMSLVPYIFTVIFLYSMINTIFSSPQIGFIIFILPVYIIGFLDFNKCSENTNDLVNFSQEKII